MFNVNFDEELNKQIQQQIKKGKSEEEAEKNAEIFLEAKDLLIKWENRDPRHNWIIGKMTLKKGFVKCYVFCSNNFCII